MSGEVYRVVNSDGSVSQRPGNGARYYPTLGRASQGLRHAGRHAKVQVARGIEWEDVSFPE